MRTSSTNQCLFPSVVVQRKRLCVSTIHTYWPALEIPDVATMPVYIDCSRCLAQEILVAPPAASGYRCIQIGSKGGIIQFFYSPLKQAILLGNPDLFNGIFGYFALLLLYSFTKPCTLVMYKLKEVFFYFL